MSGDCMIERSRRIGDAEGGVVTGGMNGCD